MSKYIKKNQSLLKHLIELRKCLIKCFLSILIFFFILLFFSHKIYLFISSPLLQYLPKNASMISTDIISTFLIPLKFVFFSSILLSFPIIIYQIWMFISPALYFYEKKILIFLMLITIIMFYLGMIFTYYIVLPMFFSFFINTTPKNVIFFVDIKKYFDFIFYLIISFSFAFEIPVVIFLLCFTKITNVKYLKNKRAYIFVLSFIIGTILTPPDVLSQIFISLPIYILFEIGVFFSYLNKFNNNNIKKINK